MAGKGVLGCTFQFSGRSQMLGHCAVYGSNAIALYLLLVAHTMCVFACQP